MNKAQGSPRQQLLELLRPQIKAGQVLVCTAEEDRAYCDLIRSYFPLTTFPYQGALICWSLEAHGGHEPESVTTHSVLEEVIARMGLKGTDLLVVIWDDAKYPSIVMSVELVHQHLDALTSMPPHMFIVPRDVSWAACFRMEGDMGFGVRPA